MKRQQRLQWMTNSGGRVSGRGLVRYRLAAAGLLFLLLLSGCVSSIETKISVGANGAWTGELRLFFAPPLAAASGQGNALDAQVQEQVEALLGGRGIRYSWEKASALDGSAVYTFRLQGQNLHALAEVMLAEDTVGAWLNGPVALDMQGNVQAGQGLEIALPARPSTGYSWAVKATSGGLSQVGAVESRQVQPGLGTLSRQVVRFQAATAGPAGFQLLYRRPWMADATPTRVLSLRVSEMDLAAACGALSMPATPLPAPAGVPVLRASAGVAAPSAQPPVVLQAAYNWCEHSGCTPIKDQGLCGSCWAFGTVGPLESNILMHDGQTTDLSEQYLLSCNVEGWNCDGGWWAHDYHLSFMPPGETQAGAVLESEMPYQADATVPCNPPHNHHYRISSWAYVGDGQSVPSVSAIKLAMLSHGPVAAAICVGTAFQDYTGGVFETDESAACSDPKFVNHAIVLVGWDDSQGTSGVWILRNSWNTGWGENGYMRIGYSTSRVGYAANYVVYTPAVPPTNWVYLPLVFRNVATGPTPTVTPGPTPSPTSSPGWQTIVYENFEGAFPGPWDVSDNNGPTYGEYYWGQRNCRPFEGGFSGWGVGGGANGAALACGANYPDNADGWMVYGPFSLADASAADMSFKLWLYSEMSYDGVCRMYSTDGSSFDGTCTSGNSAGWIDRVLDLSPVVGQPSVWILLEFFSDGSNNYPEGGYVDNVLVRKCVGVCGQPAPAPLPGGQVQEWPVHLQLPNRVH